MAQPKTKVETIAAPAVDAAPAETTLKSEVLAPEAQPETPVEAAAAAVPTVLADGPEIARDLAGKSVAEAQDAFSRLKTEVEEASEVVEDTYATASKGVSALGLKTLETVRVSTNAAFDHAVALLGVKTLADAIELNTAFVRKQAETLTLHGREFRELARKVAAESTAPVKARFEKALKSAA